MLTQLRLQNFKCFGAPQRAELAPITLVYGQNAGGKSALLQALLLLKQSLESSASQFQDLSPRGEWVDLGSYHSFAHRHDTAQELSLSVDGLDDHGILQGASFHYRAERTLQEERAPADDLSLSGAPVWRSHSLRGRLETVVLRMLGPGQHSPLELPFVRSGEDRDPEYSVAGHLMRGRRFRLRDEASARAIARALLSSDPGAFSRSTQNRILVERERVNTARQEKIRAEIADLSARLTTLESDPTLTQEMTELLDKLKMQKADLERIWAAQTPRPPSLEDLSEWLISREFEGFSVPRDLIYPEADFPRQFRLSASRLVSEIQELHAFLGRMLGGVSLLGPQRGQPRRLYEAVPARSEGVDPAAQDLIAVIARRDGGELRQLNRWIAQLRIPYSFEVRVEDLTPAGEFLLPILRDERNGTDITLADVGFGVGQVIPILMQGIMPEASTICVMQPELHLHPRLQADLADFFIDTALPQGVRESILPSPARQWILETHSEALILRIQRRIREGRLPAEAVSVLYVEAAVGGSRIQRLHLDDRGRLLDAWPGGFFEESFHELFGEH